MPGARGFLRRNGAAAATRGRQRIRGYARHAPFPAKQVHPHAPGRPAPLRPHAPLPRRLSRCRRARGVRQGPGLLGFADPHRRTPPRGRRALHGLLQGTGGHVPQAAPRLRGLHGLCPCREGTGFAAAARTEQSHPREAGVVRTRPDGARRGAAYGPPPQNCPGLRFAGTAGDRCGRRCDLCRQPPYPATAEGVTPANEARPRKRTQKGRIRQLGLPRSAYAAQLHHGILRAALRRGDHPGVARPILRNHPGQPPPAAIPVRRHARGGLPRKPARAAAVPVYEPLRRMPGATADHEGEVPQAWHRLQRRDPGRGDCAQHQRQIPDDTHLGTARQRL